FLSLHASVGNSGNLAIVHFGKDIDLLSSRMDLVLAILFDPFAKKVFSVKMVFLLREGDARRVDRGSCRDHSEYNTPINHVTCSLERLYAHNAARISLYGAFFCQGVSSFVSFFVRSQSPFLRPDPQLADVVARRSCQGWPSRRPCGMLRACQAIP